MFTGLVLCTGDVRHVERLGGETRLTIRPHTPFTDVKQGESIAVNGACLSVEQFDSLDFSAFASRETMRLTNLGGLAPGIRVNLERALAFGDRLGGHLVSGHVDALATVDSLTPAGSSLRIRIRFPEEFSPQVIAKGSVALDGVSLTVNHCGAGFLEVNVIPETQKATTVGTWRAGREINFETDLIGKYVQRMLDIRRESAPESGLTMDFLREHGF